MIFRRRTLLALTALSLFILSVWTNVAHAALDTVYTLTTNGPESLAKAHELMEAGDYEKASLYYWRAVLFQEQSGGAYGVEEAFGGFMKSYAVQGRTADGFVYIAKESMQRGQKEMAQQYVQQALQMEPDHVEAQALKERFSQAGAGLGGAATKVQPKKERSNKFQPQFGTPEADNPLADKTPEDLYEYGSTLFSRRNYEHCADVFELSCRRSDYTLGPSCTNAVYCRTMVLDWGYNGTQYEQDMERIIELTKNEVASFRTGNLEEFQWQRATSVHPHMMLGYPVPPLLKRYVAEAVAFMDEPMARVTEDGQLVPLPSDLPFDPMSERNKYIAEAQSADFKLKVGFVGSGFNSKAVLYLSQDIFRFYDRSKIEMHVFSLGPPDNQNFIDIGMRGVDWRERVKGHVDHFHDVQTFKMDHMALARFIHEQGLHVLIEWDGYARQGERAQGLFALRPAPVQILHQEFLGTSGAQYVDYIVTDKVTSPPELESLYTEKFIYMPNHFFSKGHAVQSEVKKPTHEYKPKSDPYQIGTGSPQENKCLAGAKARDPTFVFCNFNKFLKNSPETMRSWIRILRETPGSILCLLENPETGTPYLRRFVHEATGSPTTYKDKDGNVFNTFDPVDGDDLNNRIFFLPWERNPFDHQSRNQDFCNVMLDSYPYNGHTVAQDSLYGGVPIVTRSDGDDMSSRVTTSANIVLGLEELNAVNGPSQYEDIAIDLGTNSEKYHDIRRRLIDTALQRNPMHPYWDAHRYTKNLETGLFMAWEVFLAGKKPEHITIIETDLASRGTHDDILELHPSDRTHDEL